MSIENTASGLKKQIEQEISQYLTGTVPIGENKEYSQHKLVRRISLFENHVYPTGKFDSQGNYKFWFDVQTSCIDSEVKNVDFDTRNIEVYSPRKSDELACVVCNLKMREYLRKTGQAEEINSTIEEGSGWGNFVLKRVKGGYERVDLRNFYVINQAARSLNDSPVIEKHQLQQADLRAKKDTWDNVTEVIKQCGANSYQSETGETAQDTTTPYYDIFERNGEVSVKDLKEANGKTAREGDDEKFVHAKVIAAGKKAQITDAVTIEFIMFAEETGKTNEDIYEEFHRGRYKGRWFREGIYELTFDIQVRANQIGNQIAQGLEFASKTWFTSEDKLIVQNIMTDMRNGDVIRTKGLTQVEVRMNGLDQLIADWNRLMELRNEICNSREVVQGETPPSGTPLGTTQLMNLNAGKLYDFIREKIAIPYTRVFENWIVPEQVKELKAEEILRLTGDSDMLKRLHELVVEDWYLTNLVALGPHTPEIAMALKQQKMQELAQRPELYMEGIKEKFKNFKPHVSIVITGEQVNLDAELQTLGGFAQLEPDPIRRQAIIEVMGRKKGLDLGSLPKSPPMPQQPAPVTKALTPTAA